MKDLLGKEIKIGYSETELIWIKAANTLHGSERICAIDQIAEMTGRTAAAILDKANLMRAAQRNEARAVLHSMVPARRVMAPVRSLPMLQRSTIRQPTKLQLMAGR